MSGLRIRRIHLTDFRGVADRELTFGEVGVTVVEGPNESGKSSIADALDLLLEYKHSSNHRAVAAVRPVGSNRSPAVEVDMTAGPYDITYGKRWGAGAAGETHLVVRSPHPETLAGDPAHDRAREILAANADLALWSALRLLQGREVRQASVEATGSLGAALERAAGGAAPSEEGGLFGRAEAEYARYYTPTGREKDVFDRPRADVVSARETVARLRADRDAVEADADRLQRVTADLAGMHETLAAQEEAVRQRDARLAEVERLAGASREAKAAHDAALARAGAASTASEARRALVAALVAAEAERDALEAESTADAERRERLAADLAAAAERLAGARERRDRAAGAAAVRRADVDGIRDAADLVSLASRKDRIDRLTEEGRIAQAGVETNPVTDDVLAAVERTAQDAALARARLEGGAGEVVIAALGPAELTIDGAALSLAAGAEEARPIGDGIEVVVPGLVRVTARPGTSAAGLRADLERADEAAAAALTTAGVTDAAEARTRNLARRADEATVQRARREIVAILAGERQQEIEQRIVTLEARAAERAATLGQRPPELPVPAGIAEALAAIEAAEADERAAAAGLQIAEEAERAARTASDAERSASEERRVRAGVAVARAAQLRQDLDAARADASDAALEERLADAGRAVAEALVLLRAAETTLAAANPDQARLLAENARKTLEGMRKAHLDLTVEQARLAGLLERRGEAGLGEQLDRAEGELERVSSDLARLRRRAVAAQLLFETLRAHRDAARRRYVLPLKEKLEALGRFVFGPDVVVDVADDLSIASVARNGIAIPWDQLSVGTREQLGVLMRLACAELVAADGGVPVLIDDALGWSDPQRLETMGAVLARAGTTSQVIVLTCFPERYVHVGGATVIRLG